MSSWRGLVELVAPFLIVSALSMVFVVAVTSRHSSPLSDFNRDYCQFIKHSQSNGAEEQRLEALCAKIQESVENRKGAESTKANYLLVHALVSLLVAVFVYWSDKKRISADK